MMRQCGTRNPHSDDEAHGVVIVQICASRIMGLSYPTVRIGAPAAITLINM